MSKNRRNSIRIIVSRIVSVSGEGFDRTVHTNQTVSHSLSYKKDKKSTVNIGILLKVLE